MKVGYIIGPFRAPSQWEMAQNIKLWLKENQ